MQWYCWWPPVAAAAALPIPFIAKRRATAGACPGAASHACMRPGTPCLSSRCPGCRLCSRKGGRHWQSPADPQQQCGELLLTNRCAHAQRVHAPMQNNAVRAASYRVSGRRAGSGHMDTCTKSDRLDGSPQHGNERASPMHELQGPPRQLPSPPMPTSDSGSLSAAGSTLWGMRKVPLASPMRARVDHTPASSPLEPGPPPAWEASYASLGKKTQGGGGARGDQAAQVCVWQSANQDGRQQCSGVPGASRAPAGRSRPSLLETQHTKSCQTARSRCQPSTARPLASHGLATNCFHTLTRGPHKRRGRWR